MSKVRRIDFFPDEFIAGITGQMLPDEIGVYWVVCSLIYSRGGPIKNDPKRLSLVMGGAHVRTIKAILQRLHDSGKIVCTDAELSVNRCLKELERTGERIAKNTANGALGGKKANKNNETDQANAVSDAKANPKAKNPPTRELTTSNQQPTTNNDQTGGRASPGSGQDEEPLEIPPFLDRRPKPADQPSKPPPDPKSDELEYQDALIEATGLDPQSNTDPGRISRAYDALRGLVDVAQRHGFTANEAAQIVTEKRQAKVADGDPPTSFKFYHTCLDQAAQRRAVTNGGGNVPAPDQPGLQRLMRVQNFVTRKFWHDGWGKPPSDAECHAAKGWSSGQPVPNVFKAGGG